MSDKYPLGGKPGALAHTSENKMDAAIRERNIATLIVAARAVVVERWELYGDLTGAINALDHTLRPFEWEARE